MATEAVARSGDGLKAPVMLPGRRYDHYFFSGMALLMLATVFEGFARTYYLAGVFRAPLPSLIIHVHGAAFSCWILLLVAQTSLISVGRVDIHRRLGIAGFVLAILMVILGVMAATDLLVREGGPPGTDAKFFYIVPLSGMMIFGPLIFFAFRARTNPPAHKRLILVATTALVVAAIVRWPFPTVQSVSAAYRFSYIFLILLVAYDLWSTRMIHRATLWAGAFLIFVEQITQPVGHTTAWHAFAGWVQSLAR
jgi:hypothetical protein